jgi:hypothetical protein
LIKAPPDVQLGLIETACHDTQSGAQQGKTWHYEQEAGKHREQREDHPYGHEYTSQRNIQYRLPVMLFLLLLSALIALHKTLSRFTVPQLLIILPRFS